MQTIGSDLDADGYTILIGGTSNLIGVNGEVTLGGVQTGALVIELTGLADNCAVTGPNPRTVTVTAGSTVEAVFQVTCTALAPQSWDAAADMPTARLGLATAVVNGQVYAIGGYQQANAPGLGMVEQYDPASDTWTTRAPMQTGRRWLAAAVVNGRIYALGGHRTVGAAGLPNVEEYDPATDTWTTMADMPTPRLAVRAAAVNGKIYAVGGSTDNQSIVATVEEYDPATDTWTRKADMPSARALVALESVGGKLYAIGGGPNPAEGVTVVEIYDPVSDSWAAGMAMPTARTAPCSGVVGGKVFVIGGSDGGLPDAVTHASVEAYDPLSDQWAAHEQMPTARLGLSCAVVDGRIFAIGGARDVQPPHPGIQNVEVFDPTIH